MSLLTDLTTAIQSGSIQVIDLTAPLNDTTPVIRLPEPFGNTATFALHEISRYDDRGPAWYWNDISTGEHTGTHFDAPVHWVTGRDGADVAQVPVSRLIAPAVVLDFTAQAATDPDFLLEIEHVQGWVGEHGPLPEGGWLLYRTGWDARSASQQDFLNADETGPHTPGISVACAQWLAASESLIGLGVETVGTDAGAAHSFDPPFPCHASLLGAGKYGLTQLQNLALLPPTGAVVIAGPLPITGGSGSPCRAIALIERPGGQPPGNAAGQPGLAVGWASLMRVTEAVAATLAGLGADTVFGVVGSGNFHLTNALISQGARYTAARHEGGAACMADGWARTAGRTGLLSVHQGPGLTNAVTGITEAAKSRTPLVVLAADVAAAAVRSNFRIDVAALASAVGAVPERLHSPGSAAADTARAYHTATAQRRTVILAMPLDVQAGDCGRQPPATGPVLGPVAPTADAADALAGQLALAKRPVFVAGRGARVARAGPDLERLADACGALLATSAAARGLFRGNPWDLDVSGGFASPLAAELISAADLIVGWGCALNMWTMRSGALIGPEATVVQVDDDQAAIGAHRPVHLGVLGDAAETARAALAALGDRFGSGLGYRTGEVRERIAGEVRWRDVPYPDESGDGLIDPRTLTIALDDMLPVQRTVSVDSGNFMGYPSMYLAVPDADAFCFTQAYQSIGLGLASAIGAAIARPDRLTVAALGDGGALMAVSELETVVRLGLPMLIVVYDDEAYGAEVHHFGPDGHPLDTVRFPPADLAGISRGFGCDGVTVRGLADLGPVRDWLDGPRERPMLIDAKITSSRGAWWLEEAFRGH